MAPRVDVTKTPPEKRKIPNLDEEDKDNNNGPDKGKMPDLPIKKPDQDTIAEEEKKNSRVRYV
jgi:hypothetical protein